jgi:hypothetical protein
VVSVVAVLSAVVCIFITVLSRGGRDTVWYYLCV